VTLRNTRFNRLGDALAAVFLASLLASCSSSSATFAQVHLKAEKDRKAARDFTLQGPDGTAVHLSDYKGRVVLLNFWATWCSPCEIEVPWFIEFERRYKDRGLAVIGVSMDDEGWQAVKPYIQVKRVNYRVLIGNDEIAQLFGGIEALPTTLLIDHEGRIASTHVGLVGRAEYATEIERLLAGAKHAQAR